MPTSLHTPSGRPLGVARLTPYIRRDAPFTHLIFNTRPPYHKVHNIISPQLNELYYYISLVLDGMFIFQKTAIPLDDSRYPLDHETKISPGRRVMPSRQTVCLPQGDKNFVMPYRHHLTHLLAALRRPPAYIRDGHIRGRSGRQTDIPPAPYLRVKKMAASRNIFL